MAVCTFCNDDMLKVDDCSANRIIRFEDDSKDYNASTAHFTEENGRCHDCYVKHGNYHHPGCDTERCPKCGGQLISCDCTIVETA